MRTVWKCEKCKEVYDTREEAEECEKQHIDPIGISYEYDPNMKYPAYLNVSFFDNVTRRTIKYKKEG